VGYKSKAPPESLLDNHVRPVYKQHLGIKPLFSKILSMKAKITGLLMSLLCFLVPAMRPTLGVAQIVSNGGFETPVAPPAGDINYILFSAGESIPGWTVDLGAIALMGFDSSGQRQQVLALDGAIYQDLSTLRGVDYLLSFSAWFGGDDVPPPLSVSWGTTTLSVRGAAAAPTYSFMLAATEAATRLALSSRDFNVAVDNVTVVPVARLGITMFGNAQARLTWHTNFSDYVVEYATSLPATFWAPVTNNVTVVGDYVAVTVDTAGVQRVFRLRGP
jgi:hypothetical protein